MVRKTREEALKTKRLIMTVAKKLFCEKGLDRTKLCDIAAKSGLTRGAIYWHFANIDELFIELWDDMMANHNLLLFCNDGSSLDNYSVKNSIRNWIRSLAIGIDDEKECFLKILTSVVFGDQGTSRIRSMVINNYEENRKILEEELAKGVVWKELPSNLDIDAASHYVFSEMSGLIINSVYWGGALRRHIDVYSQMVVDNMTKFVSHGNLNFNDFLCKK